MCLLLRLLEYSVGTRALDLHALKKHSFEKLGIDDLDDSVEVHDVECVVAHEVIDQVVSEASLQHAQQRQEVILVSQLLYLRSHLPVQQVSQVVLHHEWKCRVHKELNEVFAIFSLRECNV